LTIPNGSPVKALGDDRLLGRLRIQSFLKPSPSHKHTPPSFLNPLAFLNHHHYFASTKLQ
jgi:hypothetical protein